jgi:hypothetical protein
LLLVGFGAGTYLHASPTDSNDSTEIVSLVKLVYKQDTRTFLRIEIKESIDETIKYYQRFFTPETAKILVKNLSQIGVSGPFASDDPRYCVPIDPDPDTDDWYKYIPRVIVKKMKFHTPTIKNNQAVLEVDNLIDGSTQEYRSVYYLNKTNNFWRISNIEWEPKGTFEENSKQGIRSIL